MRRRTWLVCHLCAQHYARHGSASRGSVCIDGCCVAGRSPSRASPWSRNSSSDIRQLGRRGVSNGRHWNADAQGESISVELSVKKGKGSPYSITERRVPELIPVLGSQPACDMSHKHGGRLPLLSARPVVTLATLKRATTTASWLRFEPGPFCA